MNEQDLRLQAYLDGEMTPREAAEIEQWLKKDPAASSLLQELRTVREVLRTNEPEIKLPETREFYWSKISRAIEAEEKSVSRLAPAVSWWKPAWAQPLLAVGVLGFMLLCGIFLLPRQSPLLVSEVVLSEVEASNDDMDSVTYRSEADRMTVVYLFNREPSDASDIGGDSLIQ